MSKSKRQRVRATASDVEDGTLGGCRACGELQEGCEPDARGYECDSCGERQVYGLEELVMMGEIDLVEDNDDGEDSEVEDDNEG